MKRNENDKLVAKHFREKMPADIQRLANLAYCDLYFGPLQGCDVCGADYTSDCSCDVRWPGFKAAVKRVGEWADAELSDVWLDAFCGQVLESEPQGEIDVETQEYIEPNFEYVYHYETRDVKRVIFGEVAEYI
jgi:hypothetical protein